MRGTRWKENTQPTQYLPVPKIFPSVSVNLSNDYYFFLIKNFTKFDHPIYIFNIVEWIEKKKEGKKKKRTIAVLGVNDE